eukprot:COSAG02_NODE_2770_length_8061_cov_7.055639_11_plen_344_part_00
MMAEAQGLSQGARPLSVNATHPLLCLPSRLLQRILSDATCHEDLLLFTSACARVCRDFWHAVRDGVAYGVGLLSHRRALVPAGYYQDGTVAIEDERARVLREIVDAMLYVREGREEDPIVDQPAICPGELELSNSLIGEAGCQVLGAALHAMPSSLALTDIYLDGCEMTARGFSSVAAAMRRGFAGEGLTRLHLYNNLDLGDTGMITLSQFLPPMLMHLGLSNTGCGDAGLLALAAALPRLTQLREMNLSNNDAVKQAAWEAFARVLPRLSSIRHLNVNNSAGMGDGGVLSFCAALEKCALSCPGILRIAGCHRTKTAKAALLDAWGKRPRAQLYLDGSYMDP